MQNVLILSSILSLFLVTFLSVSVGKYQNYENITPHLHQV